MTNTSKRTRRAGILIAGALIGSLLSVGTATGNVSAKGPKKDRVVVVDDVPDDDTTVVSAAMHSGIRW